MDIQLSAQNNNMFAKVTLLCALVAIASAGVVTTGLGYAAAPIAAVRATPVYRQAPALAYGGLGYSGLGYAAAAPVVAHHAPALVAHAAPVVAKTIVAEAAQPYEFGYSHQLEDGTVANRQESSDANNARHGSYGYTGPDGIYRQVDYVADALGYRATIRTNEPGTAPQSAAATQILAEEPPYKVLPAAAPIVKAVHAAPVYAHAAAPVYAAASHGVYAHAAPVLAKAAVPALGLGYGSAYLG